jgi:hypothetical protein
MSFLSWFSGYDSDNAARGDAADARLRQINADAAASGRYDQATIDQIERYYGTQFNTDPSTIGDAFDEGWQEGRQNVSGFITATINKIVADPLRAVIGGLPWWLWALGLAALGFYLWPLLRPLLRKVTR